MIQQESTARGPRSGEDRKYSLSIEETFKRRENADSKGQSQKASRIVKGREIIVKETKGSVSHSKQQQSLSRNSDSKRKSNSIDMSFHAGMNESVMCVVFTQITSRAEDIF
jgi:hypothetical protein